MDNVVEQLVLAPFREIAEKAKAAVENAENAGDQVPPLMRKAAEGLAKEGDRALTRIEPLCTRNYEQYGSNFVDAIKEHDEIAQYRKELVGLLWDFDDYITAEDYDGDKFEQLRGASRQAAPKIVDILKRMKLVEPERPAYPTLSPKSLSIRAPSIASGSSLTLGDAPPAEGSAPGTPLAGGDLDRTTSHQSGTFAHPADPPPPRPPSANPWQVGSPPGPPSEALDLPLDEGPTPEQHPDVVADSPTLPAAKLRRRPLPAEDHAAQRRTSSLAHVAMPVDDATERMQGASAGGRARANSTGPRPISPYDIRRSSVQSIDSPVSPMQPRSSLHFPLSTDAIPENSAVGSGQQYVARGNFSTQSHRYSSYNPPPPRSHQPSIDSFDSFFDILRAKDSSGAAVPAHTPTSPLSPSAAAQPPPASERPSSELGRAHPIEANDLTGAAFPRTPLAAEGLEVVPQPTALQRYSDPGIIPVASEEPEEPHMPPRKPDCSIGPHSSFYQCKGLCKGAENAVRGDAGYKRIKRPMGGFSTMVVAKCNACSFELDYKAVESDMKNEPSGNHSCDGIRFRLRFLRKSHIHCKYVDEQLFGCIFCITSGKTLEESDATVFLSQKQLFSHMARHPRPLPMVSGFTIFEGDTIPTAQKDDYDLWFTRATVPSQMQGISPEVAKLPAAVATETRKMTHGILRTPPDKAPVLQYAVGARIVGIEFPAKYEGKWGIGWHDGMYGVFEVDTVRLEAPPRNEVRMHGSSNMQAVARWKFRQAGEGNWLKFDKGDVIKNISWAYTDHWCWSGTSSKNWGIFPQSHIEPNTLSDKPPSDSSSFTSERKTPLSPFRSRNSDPPESPPVRRVTTGNKMQRLFGGTGIGDLSLS